MSVKPLLLKAARNGLGLIIVFLDWVSRPKKVKRTPEEQSAAQNSVDGLSLYQLYACPFCVKTRRTIHRLNIDIEARDINKNTDFRNQLKAGGGKIKVPCLRIEKDGEVTWMYESNDIIQHLESAVAS